MKLNVAVTMSKNMSKGLIVPSEISNNIILKLLYKAVVFSLFESVPLSVWLWDQGVVFSFREMRLSFNTERKMPTFMKC